MEKQKELQTEIRQLINLSVQDTTAQSISAAAKVMDSRSLESGLSYIGLEMEYGERRIAQIWSYYEGVDDVTSIKYPEKYTLKTDSDRLEEATELEKSAVMSPSVTYKREVTKYTSELRLAAKVSADTLATIKAEIDAAAYIVSDDAVLVLDVENQLVSPETASIIRGYGAEEVAKAEKAHVKRLE